MAYFGVGPAVDGTNTGKNTKQNSKMLPGGKVIDKNGRVVFDPSISLVDLLPDTPDSGKTVEGVFTSLQALELAFSDKLAGVPTGTRVDGPNGAFEEEVTRIGILLVPGEDETVADGSVSELLNAQGYGPVATALPEGSIFAYDILSGADGELVEVDPYGIQMSGRGNTTFLANGTWDYYSDGGSNAWFNAPETLGASEDNDQKFTVVVLIDVMRTTFDGVDDGTTNYTEFARYRDTSVSWPPLTIN